MTSASVTLTSPTAVSHVGAWRGRLIEFMLVGGATLVLLPLAWLYRKGVGLDFSEFSVSFFAFYGAYLINDPHFSVTYLLFYEDLKRRALGTAFSPIQRVRYVVAGFVVPLALVVWASAALASDSAKAMGLLIQLMFLLVGWHYVKQGFGVLTVLSARRGVTFSSLERKLILLHCYAGWAHAWASPADLGKEVAEKGVVYSSLAQPPGLELVTQIVFFASTIPLVWVLVQKWRREERLPPLAPLVGLLVTVWLWTVYSGLDPLLVYVIPALHSVQYLYFVWLLKRNQAREAEGPPSFGRPVSVRLTVLAVSALALGWLLFHGAPSFLDGTLVAAEASDADATGGLGATPYFAAIFAIVNIHHYFMDYVIWRRENPDTRYLRN